MPTIVVAYLYTVVREKLILCEPPQGAERGSEQGRVRPQRSTRAARGCGGRGGENAAEGGEGSGEREVGEGVGPGSQGDGQGGKGRVGGRARKSNNRDCVSICR